MCGWGYKLTIRIKYVYSSVNIWRGWKCSLVTNAFVQTACMLMTMKKVLENFSRISLCHAKMQNYFCGRKSCKSYWSINHSCSKAFSCSIRQHRHPPQNFTILIPYMGCLVILSNWHFVYLQNITIECMVELASWQNGRLAEWQVDKMGGWKNGKLTKWQVGRMAY
jgi:hypothetical protein